jgi:hypothetical protein
MKIERFHPKATDLEVSTYRERSNFLYLLFLKTVKPGISPCGHKTCIASENMSEIFGAKEQGGENGIFKSCVL